MNLKTTTLTAVFIASISTYASSYAAEVNWGYFQHGEETVVLPEQWGDFFPDCNGFEQSPVNIQNTSKAKIGEFEFNYEATPLDIINNGHTIEVEYEPGSSMTINGDEFRLLQFHFHIPSEHLSNGSNYPMEMHLVHTNTTGKLAVIGVLIEDGKMNEAFNQIINNAPQNIGTISVEGEYINVNSLMPKDTSEYYNYSGSLTTPPCSEGVLWFVMKDSISFSEKQIEKFKSILYLNARPVQETNTRTIYLNDN